MNILLQNSLALIDSLKNENRYRNFLNLSRICGNFPFAVNQANNQKIVIWCSNDYLAMGQNLDAIKNAKEAIENFGVGSGGTRNISGNHALISQLEKLIANSCNKEDSLVFSSGYVANDSSIQAIAKIIPNLVVFSDAKNHASIIAGIKNSRLEKNIFLHNNLSDLELKLQKYPSEAPKIIIAESVYSMDGDYGKIPQMVNLAKKYNAITYIDEVHAVGIYGQKGGGLCQEWQIEQEIDIIQGTLGKAFGVMGGFIAAKKPIIDAIRSVASGFIFSTSMTPANIAAAISNVDHLAKSNFERKVFHQNVKILKEKLVSEGFNIASLDSHIISIKIGNALRAKNISQKLLSDFNIYIQHINYPTVAVNDERLRITITPLHSKEMIESLVAALKYCYNFF